MSGDRCAPPSRRVPRSVATLVGAVALWLGVPGALHAEPTFPTLTGRITDEASLLQAGDRALIEAELAALEAKSTDQLAVVTLNSLQGYTIEDFGYQLGRKWGIGQKGKDNGILLIVAPKEHKVRIEVGRGLEPVMTDALSKLIIENAIVPAFKRGDYPAGISAGVRDIKDVLLGDAEAVKDRARETRQGNGLDTWSIILIAIWLCVIIFVIYAIAQSVANAPQAVPGRRRRGTGVVPSDSGSWGGSWSGGGDSGGGGGWSGGGGDFGGGGSSGSW
jgi:uncharacterized protein